MFNFLYFGPSLTSLLPPAEPFASDIKLVYEKSLCYGSGETERSELSEKGKKRKWVKDGGLKLKYVTDNITDSILKSFCRYLRAPNLRAIVSVILSPLQLTWSSGMHAIYFSSQQKHKQKLDKLLHLLRTKINHRLYCRLCQQGNRRYQTSPAVCNRTVNSIYFLNLSPINAKLTSLSCVLNIVVSSATYTVTIVASKTLSCVSVILPINRQISPLLLRVITK